MISFILNLEAICLCSGRVICFIFKYRILVFYLFLSNFAGGFDKLFSALDRKTEGFLKLTDCLLILSCVHKRFILFIRPDLFSSAILSDMLKQSLVMLSGSWFSRWIQNLKISIVICKLRDNLPSSFLDVTFVERFLNLNTSYKNVYAFSQWSLLYLLPCFPFQRQSVTSAPPSWRDSLAQIQERSSSSGTCCCEWKSTSVKQNLVARILFQKTETLFFAVACT